MIKHNELLSERKELDSSIGKLLDERKKLNFFLREDLENLGRKYRQRADININLYLNNYVLQNEESNHYKEAENDYLEAIRTLIDGNSNFHLEEAILAYGNALKEQFLPSHRNEKKDFTTIETKAKEVYKKCIESNLAIDNVRGYFFTMLEQMNLETRRKVWSQQNSLPKRVVIFHSLESPLSHQFVNGVYYFASQNLTEIWEYNYGRIPDSNKNETFISDRLLDASGVIFLCSPDYNPKNKDIVNFEIQAVKKIKEKDGDDPINIFALDIGNKSITDELKQFSTIASEKDFEDKINIFLKDLKDIYFCLKFRC